MTLVDTPNSFNFSNNIFSIFSIQIISNRIFEFEITLIIRNVIETFAFEKNELKKFRLKKLR